MKRKHLRFGRGFRVVLEDGRSQAAQMTLEAGDVEGGPDNRHGGASQWIYVVAGTGLAIVEGRRIGLRRGTLVLIERDESHEIRNTGNTALRTLNLYVPRAYDRAGNPRAAGKP